MPSVNRWAGPVLSHILEPLRKACGINVTLDGELYRHGWTLDRIAAAASLFRRQPDEDTLEVGFYVFDLVADVSFGERCSRYCRIIKKAGKHVRPVPAIPIDHASAADAVHAWYLRAGFEGTIYRIGEAGYRPGRNPYLMKRKEVRGSGFTAKREFRPRVDRWKS
jgi:hypothetical protein